jgi:hypothetical protein
VCVRVGVQVCVLGWAFIYMCEDGCSCMCVREGVHVCVLWWGLMYVLDWAFMYVLG